MCNKCECENFELCSIVGYQPYGFCCEKCVRYDSDHTCPYNVLNVKQKIPRTPKPRLQRPKSHVLPKSFCLKSPNYTRSEEKIITYLD
ncbi:MAG: hypothetical protein GF383_07140 [Candidatus Lokiarchaeota archaeon]|nr:hypothetical protein [Candidatus Lokiarchaeota archaeon]MBD3339942.1 hypothetical protein [Candidatus Lokiarchaeota archaeon]